MKRIWDISPPVQPGSPVFPGDTPYRQQWAATIGPGCPVNVSSLTMSPHVGAHADAPLHYDPQGQAIGAVDLAPFLGPCRVIHAIGCARLIQWLDIAHAAHDLPARVLVRTYERMPVDAWDPQLAAFAPDTVERLADVGVRLIGIDTASIDYGRSTLFETHVALCKHNCPIFENVADLAGLPDEGATVVALPMKIAGGSGGPLRIAAFLPK